MTAKFRSEFGLAALAAAWPAPSPLQKIPERLMRRLDRLIEATDTVAKTPFVVRVSRGEVSA